MHWPPLMTKALARGETSPNLALPADTLDEDSQERFDRARRVLERLARTRRESIAPVTDSESGEPISWYSLSRPQSSIAGTVADEAHFPRRLGRFEILARVGPRWTGGCVSSTG